MKLKEFLRKFLSIDNELTHICVTVFGIKIKLRSNRLIAVHKLNKNLHYLGWRLGNQDNDLANLINNISNLTNDVSEIKSQINDINYKQNLIMDYFLDAKNALPATGGLRKRQLENVELLKEFVRICHKHNINYWLDYGALLGSIRHNGHCIPWDDDLDVSMLYEDLTKFKNIVGELEDKYEVLYRYEGAHLRIVFKNDTGAFLDVFSYEDLIDNVKSIPVFYIDSYDSLIPKKVLFPLASIQFEGLDVYCPKDIDNYLRIKYGNYNLLPKHKHCIADHNSIDEHLIFYPEEINVG